MNEVLIRLHRCTGWSVPLLFAYNKIRFSCIGAHTGLTPLSNWTTYGHRIDTGKQLYVKDIFLMYYNCTLECHYSMVLAIHDQKQV